MKFVDKYGRARPTGIRRIRVGKGVSERPLPFELQVHPQRAEPRSFNIRGIAKRAPWYGFYLKYLEMLVNQEPVGTLIAISSLSSSFSIYLNNEERYKIRTKNSLEAFGLTKALAEYSGLPFELVQSL